MRNEVISSLVFHFIRKKPENPARAPAVDAPAKRARRAPTMPSGAKYIVQRVVMRAPPYIWPSPPRLKFPDCIARETPKPPNIRGIALLRCCRNSTALQRAKEKYPRVFPGFLLSISEGLSQLIVLSTIRRGFCALAPGGNTFLFLFSTRGPPVSDT